MLADVPKMLEPLGDHIVAVQGQTDLDRGLERLPSRGVLSSAP